MLNISQCSTVHWYLRDSRRRCLPNSNVAKKGAPTNGVKTAISVSTWYPFPERLCAICNVHYDSNAIRRECRFQLEYFSVK